MNPLLEQFLSESREVSEAIGEKLMQLETAPGDAGLVTELFRLVHTLKGNSGLFSFPEMTRVLHAGEDLLGMVRDNRIAYSRQLADRLLDAVDLFAGMCGDIEKTETIHAGRAADSVRMAEALRALMPAAIQDAGPGSPNAVAAPANAAAGLPPALRLVAERRGPGAEPLQWVVYTPGRDCFFQGDDPFHRARQTPEIVAGCVRTLEPLPTLPELDTFRSILTFHLLTAATQEELAEYFRYVLDEVRIVPLDPATLHQPAQDAAQPPPVAAQSTPVAGREAAILATILQVQRRILSLDDAPPWKPGRTRAVAAVLAGLAHAAGNQAAARLEEAVAASLPGSTAPLLQWINDWEEPICAQAGEDLAASPALHASPSAPGALPPGPPAEAHPPTAPAEEPIKFGRRAEDAYNGPRSLKVDQAKIDRLMSLIGELVVEKNALPYLAQRAEAQYGVRELSREIKGQYSVINRIADEMQDAIMQVRMMAVSFIFQRFPRLVRDTSRKLGKEVHLVLEGEQTEADKSIIESLADPLIHIVRNSLDHGIETPEVRRARGKPEAGTLTIRAAQQADRVVIEIADDGKGIDPAVIKRKAYEKGLIDEAALERMSDQDAVNLIFAAGFSTAEVISDLSGRGVGMDVVRSAVERVNGTVVVNSQPGLGTTLRISLPLSMAVTQVMIVESDRQIFGVPMDHVLETVRVPRAAVRRIKQVMAAVLRGRVVPLKNLNHLLGLNANPLANADDELAVLLVQVGAGILGLVVDGFRGTVGVIQKPLGGFLTGLSAYSGSALMGDGSVLMILNIREIV